MLPPLINHLVGAMLTILTWMYGAGRRQVKVIEELEKVRGLVDEKAYP